MEVQGEQGPFRQCCTSISVWINFCSSCGRHRRLAYLIRIAIRYAWSQQQELLTKMQFHSHIHQSYLEFRSMHQTLLLDGKCRSLNLTSDELSSDSYSRAFLDEENARSASASVSSSPYRAPPQATSSSVASPGNEHAGLLSKVLALVTYSCRSHFTASLVTVLCPLLSYT